MADMLRFAGLLDDNDELLLLSDLFSHKEVRAYERGFELESYSEEQCRAMFRFEKQHIPILRRELGISDKFSAVNGTAVSGEEGLCIMLRRLAYPNRLEDLIPIFGRSKVELSYIFNGLLDFVYDNNSHLLSELNQTWLSKANLRNFSTAIQNSGAPLTNCWGFIDGTVRPICRPSKNQRLVFNGHKRVHAFKFQAVATPNGMIANLFGPLEGKRHDAGMLRESGLLDQLENNMTLPDGSVFCLYGDPAYPLRPHLLAPFRGAVLSPQEQVFNKKMSSARATVEWAFGKVLTNFAFVDFKKNQKLFLQPVGKYYAVATLLTNCHTCLYGSEVGDYFQLQAPTLHQYLHG